MCNLKFERTINIPSHPIPAIPSTVIANCLTTQPCEKLMTTHIFVITESDRLISASVIEYRTPVIQRTPASKKTKVVRKSPEITVYNCVYGSTVHSYCADFKYMLVSSSMC